MGTKNMKSRIHGRTAFVLVSIDSTGKNLFGTVVPGASDECEFGYELFLDESVSGKFRLIGTSHGLLGGGVVRNGEELTISSGVITAVVTH